MSCGRRVLGEKAWEAQQTAAKAAADRGAGFGSRVTGPITPSTAVEEAPPEVEEQAPPVVDKADEGTPSEDVTTSEGKSDAPAPLSLVELKQALEENATEAFLDELVDAEFARVEGPRKGGLRLLLKAEQDRDEVPPRAAIMTELTKALKV